MALQPAVVLAPAIAAACAALINRCTKPSAIGQLVTAKNAVELTVRAYVDAVRTRKLSAECSLVSAVDSLATPRHVLRRAI